MTRNVINIGSYKYLIEHYDCHKDLENNNYIGEFVMLRNFTILNNLTYDNDIYFIERKYYDEYVKELQESNTYYGNSIAFPVTNNKLISFSNTYRKFNDTFNVYDNTINNVNINHSLYNINISKNGTNEYSIGSDVYELYNIDKDDNKKTLKIAKIKCDKIKLYHPLIKKEIDAIIDITNYMNGINFHYLCRPLGKFNINSETEYKINNETYSEYIEIYFPNIEELFKVDGDSYKIYYKENYNIIASTRNENFINSIMSNSDDIEHPDLENNYQIVPLNLFLQPFRIIEEYEDDLVNYNDIASDDKKHFVKLYLKNNPISSYIKGILNIIVYPYKDIDETINLYILDDDLTIGYSSLSSNNKFNVRSRLEFSNGVISIISKFNYPNKSYFYSLYKDDETTSPIKEAYKYYNNVDDHYYKMFINDDVQKELDDIDSVDSISKEIRDIVKTVANFNSNDKTEILNVWKKIMKDTILREYEEEFKTPTNFLGFKIQIASDFNFKNVIYDKNIRINFTELDDFAFEINGIFKKWEERPNQLIAKIMFYDRLLGIELNSNLVIITKEWFKYLINNSISGRLTELTKINENDDMNVIDLSKDNEKININFINTIKCIVNKKSETSTTKESSFNQKIILKPIFYKANDIQNISIQRSLTQKIGINLSEYISKVNTFKISLDNREYVEIGRNNIYVIFEINGNEINKDIYNGRYNLLDDTGTYITSGNFTIIE